jgi:uncharacterized protein with HEPN domain
MRGPLTDKVRVKHILDAIHEIEKYLAGVSQDHFATNSEKRFATIKQLEIIGEACNSISSTIKDAHPEIEWSSIKGFRNISIHEYFDVSTELVWQIAQNDIPALKEKMSELMHSLS